MVKSFSKSKRTPVRLRHKIEKASTSKQRKIRKEARKSPLWKSRLKKDPGIPNLFPFKDKLLEEIEEKKREKAENAQRLREAAKANRQALKVSSNDVRDQNAEDPDLMDEDEDLLEEDQDSQDDGRNLDSNPMAALLASAKARATQYEEAELRGDVTAEEEDEDYQDVGTQIPQPAIDHRNPDSSRKAFDKIFKQVLEAADVILYVLDARDPEGTRSREVEREISAAASGSKRLILVLNKIDLVPPAVLKGWLTHLRRYFPTVPVRASTPASNALTFDHKQFTIKNTSEALVRSLKAYAASKQLHRPISVGVIGYPNVGKSSVINALTSRLNKGNQSSACPTGAEAGVTTSLREVKVDSKLKILDSPGIVFPSAGNETDKSARQTRTEHEARLILLNALPPSQISDPLPAVNLLLQRLSASESLYAKLFEHYGITALGPFGNGDVLSDFLVQVARKRGRLGKGGVPNLYSAAMAVIMDWRDGRIQRWVEPPILQVTSDTTMGGDPGSSSSFSGADRKELVKEWAAEFKLEGLWNDDGSNDTHA